MTITLHLWHVLVLLTVLAWLPVLTYRQSGDYDFFGPMVGCFAVVVTIALWVGYLVGRWA